MTAVTLVVAAGAGRRLGGVAKATLRLGEATFLETIANAASEAGAEVALVVVAEPHQRESVAEAQRLGLATVVNPEPERGMASSVAVGFDYLSAHHGECDAALLWPVDHPRVAVETVRSVVQQSGRERIVVPRYRGRGGHPTSFGRASWAELVRCADADDGARSVVRSEPGRVLGIDVDDIGVRADVDRPEQLG